MHPRNEYVELNEKGMPKVQAINLWNLSFKTRSFLVSFSNAHRWQTIIVLLAMYNFANRDDSHLLRSVFETNFFTLAFFLSSQAWCLRLMSWNPLKCWPTATEQTSRVPLTRYFHSFNPLCHCVMLRPNELFFCFFFLTDFHPSDSPPSSFAPPPGQCV